MKKTVLQLVLFILLFQQIQAQIKSDPYKKTYIHIGLTTLGNSLDNSLSPKDNVFKGNYGAGTGYMLEAGHIFYFGRHNAKINYGLDWTILSLTYNKMNKWKDYATAAGQDPESTIDGTKIAASAATKLGPIISFNPAEKLVIDLHAQVAPAFRYFDLDYEEDNGADGARSFAFADYAREEENRDYDPDSFKNRVAFGVAGNFGCTFRYGIIGLSVDYFTGKTKINYDADDGTGNETHGKTKVPAKSLQFKIGLNF